MALSSEGRTFIVVNADVAQLPEVVGALESFGIGIEFVGSGQQLRRASTLIFRVPDGRVADVLVALQLSGFADALAYEVGEHPPLSNVDGISGIA
jgi:hypothetical protein